MPLIILAFAILLVVSGINNKLAPNSDNSGQPTLSHLLATDFLGDGRGPSFTIWLGAIVVIGALGYIKPVKPFSNAFLVLVILAILLKGNSNQTSNGEGFFNNLFAFIQNPAPPRQPTTNSQSGSVPLGVTGTDGITGLDFIGANGSLGLDLFSGASSSGTLNNPVIFGGESNDPLVLF